MLDNLGYSHKGRKGISTKVPIWILSLLFSGKLEIVGSWNSSLLSYIIIYFWSEDSEELKIKGHFCLHFSCCAESGDVLNIFILKLQQQSKSGKWLQL